MKDKLKKSEIIYTGRIINLEKDELEDLSGNKYIREIVRHPGAVAIVPFINDEEIFLLRQYRYAHNEVIYEIPAGTLEKGEDYETCAHRELQEELGFTASCLKELILLYPSPGVMNEKIMLFKATGLIKSEQNLDFDEDLAVERIKFNDAVQLIKEGKIKDAKTICGLLFLKEFGR